VLAAHSLGLTIGSYAREIRSMELYLIRHAQSFNNAAPEELRVEDPPLTELGHEQARRLAEIAPALQLTKIVTSPFLRTLQTTEHLRKTTGLVPHVRIELHEHGGCVSGNSLRGHVGRPGMSRSEILTQFAGYELAVDIDGDGWWRSQPYESIESAQLRAKTLLERTIADYAATDARIAYVMHADFKRIFLEVFHREPLIFPFNASISRLTITPHSTRLDDYNNVDHLDAELISS
jgi:2,3-bisphosphoglycerate-dependent phosphoglycerate mutase